MLPGRPAICQPPFWLGLKQPTTEQPAHLQCISTLLGSQGSGQELAAWWPAGNLQSHGEDGWRPLQPESTKARGAAGARSASTGHWAGHSAAEHRVLVWSCCCSECFFWEKKKNITILGWFFLSVGVLLTSGWWCLRQNPESQNGWGWKGPLAVLSGPNHSAQARTPRVCCLGPWLDGFWRSLRKENPQPIWETCTRAWLPAH